MMRGALLTMIALTLSTGLGAAQKTPTASKAWIKAPAGDASTTTAFVIIENPTMYDVYVVSAETDVATGVKFQKGSAQNVEAVEQLTAPAYDSVALTPDGVHMVLTGLKKRLRAGDKVTLVFATDNGVSFEVVADVRQ